MAERHTCTYPYCSAPVPPAQKGAHRYCLPHYSWVQSNKLCYNCLHKKETEGNWLCNECHRIESGKRRATAIDTGLCTNYWKCHNAAAPDGRMCETCYEEYRQRHAQPSPAPTPAGERTQLSIKRPPAQSAEAAVDEAESQ